jgi:hypothetical protein
MSHNKNLRDRASELVDSLAPHVESARDKAGPALADARDRAVPLLHDAKDRAVPLLHDARDKATPYLVLATPYLTDARDKAAPLVAEAKDRLTSDVLPVVTAAVAALDDATEEVRHEAVKRGLAVAAALKGEAANVLEPEPEPSHKLRNVLVALGLGGAGFAAFKKFGPQKSTSDWQSSYTPPASVPTTDDTAASDPAEAVADATDVPHSATTPDNPVVEVNIDKQP